MCTPFLPGLYIIFYWRKKEELIQFTVPQYTRPESRLLFNKTSQKPSGNISRNWLDLSGGNLFVTQPLLDRDLINFCYCFLCLTMTLFLRKQIIFIIFQHVLWDTRFNIPDFFPLTNHLEQLNYLYAPPPVKNPFSQFAAHVHTLEMRRQLQGRRETVI